MITSPDLIYCSGDWAAYEDEIYEVFLNTFVRKGLYFNGLPVKAQYRPETRGKGFSFWHVITEAPESHNRNEDDRITNLRRCERIAWIGWTIQNATKGVDGFSWWENKRGSSQHVVIWAESFDFAVVLAKRNGYYVLKTAYGEMKSNRRKAFERERAAFNYARKD